MNLSLSVILDVVLGVTFIYLVLSLFAAEVHESLAGIFQWRANHLKRSIFILLGGRSKDWRGPSNRPHRQNHSESSQCLSDGNSRNAFELTENLYESSAVKLLTQESSRLRIFGEKTGPSYLSSKAFASALLEVLVDGNADATDPSGLSGLDPEFFAKYQKLLVERTDIPETLRKHLLWLMRQSAIAAQKPPGVSRLENESAKMKRFVEEIQSWFDESQKRSLGAYKRNTKPVLFLIGFSAAIATNSNAFSIIDGLYQQQPARDAIVGAAQTTLENSLDCTTSEECVDNVKTALENDRVFDELIGSGSLPIGWNPPLDNEDPEPHDHPGNLLYAVFGWLLSGLAVMMGAPFWFDLLKNVFNVRNAGAEPKTSEQKPPTE